MYVQFVNISKLRKPTEMYCFYELWIDCGKVALSNLTAGRIRTKKILYDVVPKWRKTPSILNVSNFSDIVDFLCAQIDSNLASANTRLVLTFLYGLNLMISFSSKPVKRGNKLKEDPGVWFVVLVAELWSKLSNFGVPGSTAGLLGEKSQYIC